MIKRMKKILICNLLACFLLINISLVSAYEFVNPESEMYIKWDRKQIYDLVDLYYDIVGTRSTNYLITNYSGMCSIVTVSDGENAGTYPLEEYVAGVVKAELGGAISQPEALKAQAVAARSFLIATKESSSSCTVESSQNYQVFRKIDPNNSNDQVYIAAAQATAGQVIMRNGNVARTHYISLPNPKFYYEKDGQFHVNMQRFSEDKSTKWTWTGPSYSAVKAPIGSYTPSRSLEHNWGMSQVIAVYLASTGYDYNRILDTFYGGNTGGAVQTLPDGDYTGESELVTGSFGDIKYWNQLDFSNYYYSSDAKRAAYGSPGNYATIATHGCGPTSLAIVLSSFAKRDISPVSLTEELCQMGGCTASGSIWGHMASLAKKYGYKVEFANRNNSTKVTNALASGKSLVIAYMGRGIFTTGAHYIVLTGVRNDGNVSVADPVSRTKTTQKWFSLNMIIEQTVRSTNEPFMIITKQ